MQLSTPDSKAIWTDLGRDDSAADVGTVIDSTGALHIEIDAAAPISYIALRWRRPLPPDARILGDHWERGYGDLEWRAVAPERVLPWYFLAHEPKSGSTVGVGVETGASSFASWRVDEEGLTLVLDTRCGGLGVRLGGRRLHAATVKSLRSRAGESAFATAKRLCAALCPSPRLPERSVYGGNDWYFRYGDISDDTVRRDSALIRDLAPPGENIPSYVIDAGWFDSVDCTVGGPYERGNARFPDMAALAASLAANQIRPGIWIRPLLFGSGVPDSWRLPAEHPLSSSKLAYLDPSKPEVLSQVAADIGRLYDWGYRVIKHDFTTYDITGRWGREMGPEVTPGGWSFADRSRTTAEILRGLYQTIRDAAADAILIGCNTVGHLGAGLFEMQRTGDDTSGRHWERTRKMGVNTLAFRLAQHNTLFAADADCVGLTKQIDWNKNRQWLDLIARSGTPLFVSADPDAVVAEQRDALKQAFAIAAVDQPGAEPLDWMETTAPRRWRFGSETSEYDWNAFEESAFGC